MQLNKTNHDYSKWSANIVYLDYLDFISNYEFVGDSLLVINFGSISIDILLKGFNEFGLSASTEKSNSCLVVFGGALGKRGIPPFFSGVTLASELELPLISISDPSLSLDESLMLSWYIGNYLELNLPVKLGIILDIIFEKVNLKPILLGGSGGGFSALLQTSLLNTEVITLIWNPQTNICKYHINHVVNFLTVCFPNLLDEIQGVSLFSGVERLSVVENIAKGIGLKFNLCDIDFTGKSNIVYLQNISDKHHINEHFKSFFEKKHCFSRLGVNSFSTGNGNFLHVGDWGQGHAAPPKFILINVINNIVSGKTLKDITGSLSESYLNDGFVQSFKSDNDGGKVNVFLYLKVCENGSSFEVEVAGLRSAVNLEYAIYYIEKNKRVDMKWYQDSPVFSIPLIGFDKVHVFIKDFFGNKIDQMIPVNLENKL